MKTKSFIVLLALLLCSGEIDLAQAPVETPQAPVVTTPWRYEQPVGGKGIMTFEEDIHDFGELLQGSEARWTFRFTNTGTEPILIESVKGTCGCFIVGAWPHEPIAPDEIGEIKVMGDSRILGTFWKSFTIRSNASEIEKRLSVKGAFIPGPPEPSYLAPVEEVIPGRH